MKTLLLSSFCALLMICNQWAYAQEDDKFLLDNAVELEEGRYDDIKGSPYLFPDFVKADIIDLENKEYKGIPLNFNGHSGNFEIKRGDMFINLDEKLYRQITIELEDQKMEFFRGIDRAAPNRFVQVVYTGKRLKLIRNFKANIQERKVEAPNKTMLIKKFIPLKLYYIADTGELQFVKLTKKGVAKVLGKGVEQYAKKMKINLGTEEGLIAGLKYYEKTMVE